MNKTLTINISGIVFHIEENAYESLNKYLNEIKACFTAADGGIEIMADIEARIAELLQQKLNAGKQVIILSDVEYVINVMGKPEEFGASRNENNARANANQNQQSNYQEKVKRRLFRDPDEKAIGGVCSGLAAYFDVDIVWVRLAMFIMIFFGGLSLWVYIIMWIIIPEARTTADKFAMRGEAANINNIFKSFKEEANDVKERATKYGNDLKNNSYTEKIRTSTSTALTAIFSIIGRLLGLFLLIIGAILLFSYVLSLTGISVAGSNNEINHWKSAIFESQGIYNLGWLAFVIVVGVPVFMLIYSGIKLLFRIHYNNRWINLGMGLLWITGIIIGVYVSVVTAKQFSEKSRVRLGRELHNTGDTIVLKMAPASLLIKDLNVDNADDLDEYTSNNNGGYAFLEFGDDLGIMGYADLNVVESNSDSVELVISQSARGESKKEANENAREIKYNYRQYGKEIIFDQVYLLDRGAKFRAQDVDIKLKLPKGKVVYFDRSVKNMLDDVENVSNTWDGDMVSRRWIMTDKGLKCIDCENLRSVNEDENESDDQEIKFEKDGVRITDKDSEVKIDSDGVTVKDKNADVKIEDDGIKIYTSGKGKKNNKDNKEDNKK